MVHFNPENRDRTQPLSPFGITDRPQDPTGQSPKGTPAAVYDRTPIPVGQSLIARPLQENHAARLAGSARTQRPLVNFDLNNPIQRKIAHDLRAFLDKINFDEANRTVHYEFYGIDTIYDAHTSSLEHMRRVIDLYQEKGGVFDLHQEGRIDERQALALRFFMYGDWLSGKEADTLFSSESLVLRNLSRVGAVEKKTKGYQTFYRLNNLSLVSHKLPNDEVMYLFVDLPQRYRQDVSAEPTAQISSTSYILLNRLQKGFQDGDKYSGVVADFGAGTGIQAIALLKLYPDIQEAIALDIDPHSMNLNRFNAMLNGVEDRIQVVDNSNPQNFTNALAGRQLDLAVSNPPFNTVPHEYSDLFTDFGDGGDHGIDITKLFFDQALPVLRPPEGGRRGGQFIFYSVLAESSPGDFFVSQHLADEGYRGVRLSYERLDLDRLDYSRDSGVTKYAEGFSGYIARTNPGGANLPTASDFEKKLREDGITGLRPMIGRLERVKGDDPIQLVNVVTTWMPLPKLDKYYQDPGNIGGIRHRTEVVEWNPKIDKELAAKLGDLSRRLKLPKKKWDGGGIYLRQHIYSPIITEIEVRVPVQDGGSDDPSEEVDEEQE